MPGPPLHGWLDCLAWPAEGDLLGLSQVGDFWQWNLHAGLLDPDAGVSGHRDDPAVVPRGDTADPGGVGVPPDCPLTCGRKGPPLPGKMTPLHFDHFNHQGA